MIYRIILILLPILVFSINIVLMAFNLLPVPPLDGSKVLFSLLPDQTYWKLMRYERYGMILLLVLVWTGVLRSPLSAAVVWLFDRLFPVAELSFEIVRKIVV